MAWGKNFYRTSHRSTLVYLAIWKIFQVVVYYPFLGFECGSMVQNFNSGENDDMLLSDSHRLFFSYNGEFQCDREEVAIVYNLDGFCISNPTFI